MHKSITPWLDKVVFQVDLFSSFFYIPSNYCKISLQIWSFKTIIDLFQEKKFILIRDFLIFFYMKIWNPQYKG
jgi:hypothetical protein